MESPLENNKTILLSIQDKQYFYYTHYSIPKGNLKTVIFALSCVAIPVICLLGVAGNVLTICVLRRQGFKKSYNIFILALAVADTLYLVGVNNVPRVIYDRSERRGFYFPEKESMVLLVLCLIQYCLETTGKYMSMILPTFVSLERFIAVYFPLHLKHLVTCRRARVAVAILFLSWIPLYAYFVMLMRFTYTNDPVTNKSVGHILISNLTMEHPEVYRIISGLYFMISGPIPVIFVIITCTSVVVKIRNIKKRALFKPFMAKENISSTNINTEHHKSEHLRHQKPGDCQINRNNNETKSHVSSPRQFNIGKSHTLSIHQKNDCLEDITKSCPIGNDLINESKSKSNVKISLVEMLTFHKDAVGRHCNRNAPKSSALQTTTMLLSVCGLYAVIVICGSIPTIIFSRDTWESETGAVVELCIQMAVCINSSFNVLIHLGLNQHFRNTFKQLFS